MLNNFIYAQTKDLFLEQLNAGNILDEAIVFIEDTKEIWNHGHYFAGESVDPNTFAEIQTEVAAITAGKLDKSEAESTYATKEELEEIKWFVLEGDDSEIQITTSVTQEYMQNGFPREYVRSINEMASLKIGPVDNSYRVTAENVTLIQLFEQNEQIAYGPVPKENYEAMGIVVDSENNLFDLSAMLDLYSQNPDIQDDFLYGAAIVFTEDEQLVYGESIQYITLK